MCVISERRKKSFCAYFILTLTSTHPPIHTHPYTHTHKHKHTQDLAGSLLEWNRNAVFRKKTKKALMAVRKLFKEGKISRVEKVKLIHSVIYATSQEEVSQVCVCVCVCVCD